MSKAPGNGVALLVVDRRGHTIPWSLIVERDLRLATRLESWALPMVELLFGDGIEATRRRTVGVYRNPAGDLDVATFVTPLTTAETVWHLVSPAGDIVNGSPREDGTRPSQSQAELEAVRASGRYTSHAGAVAVFGMPDTSPYAPSVDAEVDGPQEAPVDGGFTAARGGQYRWYDPEPAASEEPAQKATEPPETVSAEPVAQEGTEICARGEYPEVPDLLGRGTPMCAASRAGPGFPAGGPMNVPPGPSAVVGWAARTFHIRHQV